MTIVIGSPSTPHRARGTLPPTPAQPSDGRATRAWLTAQAAAGRRQFTAAALAGTASTTGTLAASWAVATAADTALRRHTTPAAATWLLFAAGAVLAAAGRLAFVTWSARGARRVESAVRDRLLARVLGRAGDGTPVPTATAVTIVADQTGKLGAYYERYYPLALQAVLVPVVILAAVFPVSWVVGLLWLLALPMVPLNMSLAGIGAQEVSRRQAVQMDTLSRRVLDRIQGLRTLRALGAVEHEAAEVDRAAAELATRTQRVLRTAFVSSAALEYVSTFAIGLAAMYIGLNLMGFMHVPLLPGQLSLRGGLFMLLLGAPYFAPLRSFAAAYHDRADAQAAAEVLIPLLSDSSQETEAGELTRTVALGAAGRVSADAAADPGPVPAVRVELHDVSVLYPGRISHALEHVTLTVPAGRVLGVVGSSGAGKSTLLGLVGGRFLPTSGSVLVDGREPGVRAGQRQRLAAWLGQRPYLFPATLAENIALGRPDASCDRIAEAADAAGLGPLLARLPHGLDTPLGERGWGLSGGEAQRVAIARAFLSHAPLLLLDEPTAHLDAATEDALIESLRVLAAGRTVLMSAHSPAVLRICDSVVELDHGRCHAW
jgi:ATP-binding cassette subfamily C protein CydD